MRTWRRNSRRGKPPAGSPDEGDAQKPRTKLYAECPIFVHNPGQT